MSELQISLLAIGALVVIAVLVYNKWQERRLAHGTDATFRSRHDDVLFKPPARDGDQDVQAPIASGVERIEPGLHSETVAEPLGIDATVDYIVQVLIDRPVSGEVVANSDGLAALPRARWEGFNPIDGRWEAISVVRNYTKLRAALQLVSRQGAAGETELETFLVAVQDAAQQLDATLEGPDPDAALAQARELDVFCGDVDLQIALHVVSRDGQAFAGTKLRSLAEAAGFVLMTDGVFHLQDDDGRVLCTLANQEAQPFSAEAMRDLSTHGVTLLLDVPRAPGGVATFHACAAVAQHFAQSFNAMVADDNRNALDARAFNAIAAQLAVVYQTMETRGIAAGSPLALRLFS